VFKAKNMSWNVCRMARFVQTKLESNKKPIKRVSRQKQADRQQSKKVVAEGRLALTSQSDLRK